MTGPADQATPQTPTPAPAASSAVAPVEDSGTTAPPESAEQPAAGRTRRQVAIVAAGALAGALAASVRLRGLPIDREQVLAWLLAAVAVGCIHAPGRLRRFLLDWVGLLAVLTAYDYTRGAADTLGMPVHDEDLANAEAFLFGGTIPTVWLQRRFPPYGEPALWEIPVTVIYISHYLVPLTITAWLWWRDRDRWAAWLRRFLLLTAAGLLTYVLVPAVPPWLAARQGWIDPVTRSAGRGWERLGLDVADRFVDRGAQTVNLVAAFPSLHAGFAALACGFAWSRASPAAKAALLLYPAAMGFVLVLTAEHYVIDVVAGWGYAAAVCVAVARWEQRRAPADR
jgi:hypothetical protein